MFAVIVLQSFCTGLGQNAVVSISPSAFTAGLSTNSSRRVTFTCTVSSNNTPIFAVNMLVDEMQDSPGLEDRGINSFRLDAFTANLTIEPRIENNKTVISCLATLASGAVFSAPLTFLVQGILSAPPDLEVITIDSRPNFKRLSWQPPYTLDITNVEQDITGYRVCFSFSATEVCVLTEDTSYDFLSVRLPLEFLVTSINVVGESDASRVLHQACEADTGICRESVCCIMFTLVVHIGSLNSDLVRVSVSQTFSIVVSLQQVMECNHVHVGDKLKSITASRYHLL